METSCGTSAREALLIDEVSLVTGSTVFGNPEDFEEGWDGWYVEGGSWEVGMPAGSVGPGQAHTGTQCAGTVLGGEYADGFGSVGASFGRLVSPAFVVPSAVTNPRLRFWNWHDFNSDDTGQLQIRVGTDNWQTLATFTQSTSRSWSRPEANLSSYAGQLVQIGFLFTSSITGFSTRVGPGWYIDEVRLLHDFSLSLLDLPVMRAQDPACISLGIAASLPASTVSFTLSAPAGHLGDVSLNSEGCWTGTITQQEDGRWLVTLENGCPETFMGVHTAGSICFKAVSSQSTFVPLGIEKLDAAVSPAHGSGGRAVVIANEPLVEAWQTANGERMLTLFGKPFTAYDIRQSTDLATPRPWAVGWTETLPFDLFLNGPVQGELSTESILFLDATEQ